jgi:hypothetical protein
MFNCGLFVTEWSNFGQVQQPWAFGFRSCVCDVDRAPNLVIITNSYVFLIHLTWHLKEVLMWLSPFPRSTITRSCFPGERRCSRLPNNVWMTKEWLQQWEVRTTSITSFDMCKPRAPCMVTWITASQSAHHFMYINLDHGHLSPQHNTHNTPYITLCLLLPTGYNMI